MCPTSRLQHIKISTLNLNVFVPFIIVDTGSVAGMSERRRKRRWRRSQKKWRNSECDYFQRPLSWEIEDELCWDEILINEILQTSKLIFSASSDILAEEFVPFILCTRSFPLSFPRKRQRKRHFLESEPLESPSCMLLVAQTRQSATRRTVVKSNLTNFELTYFPNVFTRVVTHVQ